MFHKTRMQLTVLNTLIFFLILSLFGAALFFYVKIQLYSKIDASLLEQARNVMVTQSGIGDTLYYQSPETIDPRVFFVTRDIKGSITSQSIDKSIKISKLSSPAMLERPAQVVNESLRTVTIEGHHYRILEIPTPIRHLSFMDAALNPIAGGSPLLMTRSGNIRSFTISHNRYNGFFKGFEKSEITINKLRGNNPVPYGEIAVAGSSLRAAPGSARILAQGTSVMAAPSFGATISGISVLADSAIHWNDQIPIANANFTSMLVPSPVASMQFISNMEPENNMLQSLLFIIIAGVAVGGLMTLLAGFYLAQRALVPIRESWEKQQQFVADASHELRTPLAVIQANTELLFRHPDHTIEQESGYISTILKESKRINKLITSLLTFARSDSNQLELQLMPVNINELVSEFVQHFNPLAELKNVQIILKQDGDCEMMVDEERIHQLLVILLDNSLKYTGEQGTISILTHLSAQTFNLTIEDTGIGIAETDLPYIFERFYRSDKMRSRTDGSMGLGLSIAHWIVDRHGGKIRAESKLGMGTRIIIQIPLRR